MSKWKRTSLAIAALCVAGTLVGCGAGSPGAEGPSSQNVKTITVATAGMPKPFTYVEGKTLTGYDIEVLKKVDQILPQYHFDFQKVEFSALLTGVDSGRYQIGANSLGITPERQQKYYISDSYFQDYFGLVVPPGDSAISSLKDLGGKSTTTAPGIAASAVLEGLNKEELKTNPIKINYADSDLASQYSQINDKKFDFLIDIKSNYDSYKKELNIGPKFVSLPKEESLKLGNPNRVFIYSKDADGKKLEEAVDESLKKLNDDGTLTTLSEKFFLGSDYAPKSDS